MAERFMFPGDRAVRLNSSGDSAEDGSERRDAEGGGLAASREYIRRGWSPIPVGAGEKAPTQVGWPDQRITAEVAHLHFGGEGNIGLLTGHSLADPDWSHQPRPRVPSYSCGRGTRCLLHRLDTPTSPRVPEGSTCALGHPPVGAELPKQRIWRCDVFILSDFPANQGS